MYIQAAIDSTSELFKRLHRHPCNFLFSRFFFIRPAFGFFYCPFFLLNREKKTLHSPSIHLQVAITLHIITLGFHLFSLALYLRGISIYWCPSVHHIYCGVSSYTKYFHLFGFENFHLPFENILTYTINFSVDTKTKWKTIKFHPIFGGTKNWKKELSGNFYGDKYYLKLKSQKWKLTENWKPLWTVNTENTAFQSSGLMNIWKFDREKNSLAS